MPLCLNGIIELIKLCWTIIVPSWGPEIKAARRIVVCDAFVQVNWQGAVLGMLSLKHKDDKIRQIDADCRIADGPGSRFHSKQCKVVKRS